MQPTIATVYSIYMGNVPLPVRNAQKRVVERFLPYGWSFVQYPTSLSHASAMERLVADNPNPISIFLDVDCVPMSEHALRFISSHAERGTLAGAVQRAIHKPNDAHLFVGPCCMAFDTRTWQQVGSPTFQESERGDVGEELTYRWQEKNRSIHFLWPSEVREPRWDLRDGKRLGLGTTYENLFYHEFRIRVETGEFVKKCEAILAGADK